jgi:hypothetical protein
VLARRHGPLFGSDIELDTREELPKLGFIALLRQ